MADMLNVGDAVSWKGSMGLHLREARQLTVKKIQMLKIKNGKPVLGKQVNRLSWNRAKEGVAFLTLSNGYSACSNEVTQIENSPESIA